MAPRPLDVRAVRDLLLEPAEDADALAIEIIQTLDALRAERETWAVVTVVTPENYWARGPYATQHQAEKAMGKGVGAGGRAGVMRVYPALTAPVEETDPTAGCPRCKHPLASHNWPRSRVRGCVVGLPLVGVTKNPPHPRCDCEGDGR